MTEKIIHPLDVLLSIIGLSKKTRNRITNLSPEEISALYEIKPDSENFLPDYVREIQLLLSKMEVSKKQNCFLGRPPFMGRPYIGDVLAMVVHNLYCLKYIYEKGIANIPARSLRGFLLLGADKELFIEQLLKMRIAGNTVSVRSVIQVMELYCNVIITPPHRKERQVSNEIYGLDDACEAHFKTIYDDLPQLGPVVDWLIATKPMLDKNQRKRGWAYLEKTSQEWHKLNAVDEHYGTDISEYPSWKCLIEDHQDAWLAMFPRDTPYKLVSLTTPQQLRDESKAMHHCVYTYVESCIDGGTRIFSVCDASNGLRFATAEMFYFHGGGWELVQLKGKCNKELIHLLKNPADPLAIALDVLVKWYNENTPAGIEINRLA